MEQFDLEFISLSELSQALRISKNTAYRLLKEGHIKGFRVGRLWRIPLDEVKQYAVNCTQRKEICYDEE